MPSDERQAAPLQGRLHPLTLVLFLLNTLTGLLIPGLIVMFTGSERSLGILLFLFLGLGLIPTLIRYFTFTYRIENGELITRQGILERTERHIPLARVQDVRFEQGIMHRLLKVVDVHIETAGGKGAEASLSVLSKADGEALRRAVFEQARVRSTESAGTPLASGDTTPTEVIRRLSTRELLLAGLTSNRSVYALTIILVAWQQLMDDILPKRIYERFTQFVGSLIERWVNAGDHPSWASILVLAVLIIFAGTVLSAVGSVVLFHGFTLSRRGEDLHRSYGLITRRASSLPRRRIQLLRIEATWLRRLLHLATLRADTAGSQPADHQPGNEGRDVLVPVVRREEVDALLPVFFPNLDAAAPDWRQVSRCAIRRSTLKGAVVCVLLSALTLSLERSLLALLLLALIPAVYALNVRSFRHLGFAVGEDFFHMRRGWLSRVIWIVPVRNAQTVVVRQTPFDRRHRVATLMVDTAGQSYTGGGPSIRNVPESEALTVARTLAHRAAQTRYRW
jgi:putative membrane protein